MSNILIYFLFTIENDVIIHVISDVGEQNRSILYRSTEDVKVLSDTSNLHSMMHRCVDVQMCECRHDWNV